MPSIEQARTWYEASDGVHDFGHVLRVYNMCIHLATEEGAEMEIVKAAALLHDARGSSPTNQNERAEHQELSAQFAAQVLEEEGWGEANIQAVQHCIRAHRFRSVQNPDSLEAKVVFDADKLDVLGAVGAARTIAYAVLDGQPIYAQPSKKFITTLIKEPNEPHSSYHEYLFKLSKIKERLYTQTAKHLAENRHIYLEEFFEQLIGESEGVR